MNLAIPPSEYVVLKRIADLPDDAFDQLLRALQKVNSTDVKTDMSDVVGPHVPLIMLPELKSILRTVCSLYGVKRRQRENAVEIANLVGSTIESESAEGFSAD